MLRVLKTLFLVMNYYLYLSRGDLLRLTIFKCHRMSEQSLFKKSHFISVYA
ncbi:hypothetical protein AHAS_Ahas20G0251000 [Arachis hypogaea]